MKTHYATIKIRALAEEAKINTDELALSDELYAFYERLIEWVRFQKTSFSFEMEEDDA